MKIDKKTFWNLIIIFELVFILKACLSFLMDIPIIFSDEACIVLRAKHFINNFNIETCNTLSQLKGQDPLPLYSILISPIYAFTSGFKAYYTILILNSLLISSLVFPLYKIFSKYLKNTLHIFLSVILCVFLPEIVAYEKTIMTETLFMVLCVWILYFYMESLEETASSKFNKIMAVILSIFATFTRPFGFITLLAIGTSEIINSKKRKKIIFTLIPIILVTSAIAIWLYLGEYGYNWAERINSLKTLDDLLLVPKALTAQLNSFTIAVYFIPLFIFITNIKQAGKIKYYLLTFIILNYIISAQHIHGYYLINKDPLLITRYITVSTAYILIFGLIFIQNQKKFRLNAFSLITALIMLIALFFFEDKGIKHSLNFSLVPFYNVSIHMFGEDLIQSKHILGIPFLIYAFLLFILLALNKKRLLTGLIVASLVMQSAILYFMQINYTLVPPIVQAFTKTEYNIAYFIDNLKKANLEYAWHLLTVTDNKLEMVFLNYSGDPEKEMVDIQSKINSQDFKDKDFYQNADYIITTHEIEDLPLELTALNGLYKVYRTW